MGSFHIGAIFFFISSTAWNFASLLVMRLLTGIGLGAIIPVISTLITEFSPSKVRGTLSVLINGCWGLGGTLAAFVGYKVVLNYGWRLAMLFGCVAFLLSLLVRILLPESMRYLIGKGRLEEAQKQFRKIKLNFEDIPTQKSPLKRRLLNKKYLLGVFGLVLMPTLLFHYGSCGLL